MIVVPDWTPANLNDTMGLPWPVIHKAKKAQAEILAFYAYKARAKMVDNTYRPVRKLSVHTTHTSTVLPDPDNLLKLLLDCLKRCRLIVDDSSLWLDWDKPVMVHGEREQTVIRLTDLELRKPIPLESDPDYKRLLARMRRKKKGNKP